MGRPRAQKAKVFRFRAREPRRPSYRARHDGSLVPGKRFGRQADFSYKSIRPAFNVFGNCRVYMIWRSLTPDEADENTARLSRGLRAQEDGRLPVDILGVRFPRNLPFAKVKSAASWAIYSAIELGGSTGVRKATSGRLLHISFL